ncbi:Piso0_000677 [Millerozyma farinosa CBS 7064]|uniref:Piso0_000677 protein n=1 Tax=Pichia sorbitophila (strain ATCC MYA-4447 / BCRC 22081 / CBS 7064 / NBRC 10061 / NRRL Y-12695) TaxID=559304 RepID=G8YR77_PICSO|nr:Piso0_000677 [Millerozyma farinosa CBS 7064]
MVSPTRRPEDQEIPEVLKDALRKKKERFFLLQLEKDLIGFIKDGLTKKSRKQQYCIESKRLRNSYMRLLAHQICQCYWLEHWNNSANDIIVTLSNRDISYSSLIEAIEDENYPKVIKLSDFETNHSTHTKPASKRDETNGIRTGSDKVDICYELDKPTETIERADSRSSSTDETDGTDGADGRSTSNHIAATQERSEVDKKRDQRNKAHAPENTSRERESKGPYEHSSIPTLKKKDSFEYFSMHSHGEITDSNIDTTTTSTDIESRPETPSTNTSTTIGGKYNSKTQSLDSLNSGSFANSFAPPPVTMPVPLPYTPYQNPYTPQGMSHHQSMPMPMYMPYPQMLHTYPVGMPQPKFYPGFYPVPMHTPYYDKETERKILNNPYIIIPDDPKNTRKNKKFFRRKHSEWPTDHHNKSTLDKAPSSFTKS